MGADMIVSTLWQHESMTINWDAAHEAANKFTCPENGFPEDHPLHHSFLEEVILDQYQITNATSSQDRKRVVDEIIQPALKYVQNVIEHGSRSVASVTFDGWTVYIGGGLSWGDSPSDFVDNLDTLYGTGILEAAGFYTKNTSQ